MPEVLTDYTKHIVEAVQELSMARSLSRVMEIVRTQARTLTGADGATFILRDNGKCYYADEDAISPLWKGSRFPMESCISGWSMIHRKAVVIDDIYRDDRIPQLAYRPTFVKSLAMVPIRTMDPIGAIGTYWADQYKPTEDEVALLQCLADVTAVSIENVNLYHALEDKVKDRTAALEAAMDKLGAANEELEAFTYSVSHDLRAPLRSIIGYSDILEKENAQTLNERSIRTLGIVRKSAERMNQLIDDLLRFSQSGKGELHQREVDTNAVVRSVLDELRGSIPTKTEISIQNPLPNVVGDEAFLVQVWTNLLSNAIKYSSRKPHPVITVGSRAGDGETIFFVKDNGAGFDMTYSHKLFGVFQRLHHQKDFEGCGAGLALARRIVGRHGGRIWGEGRVDEGATFYFSIPNKSVPGRSPA